MILAFAMVLGVLQNSISVFADTLPEQTISFDGPGAKLVIDADGSFSAEGTSIQSGLLDENTEIVSSTDLEIEVLSGSIQVQKVTTTADLWVTGGGELIVYNPPIGVSRSYSVSVGGDLIVDGVLEAKHQDTSSVRVGGNLTVNPGAILSWIGMNPQGVFTNTGINVAGDINSYGEIYGSQYGGLEANGNVFLHPQSYTEIDTSSAYAISSHEMTEVNGADVRILHSNVDGLHGGVELLIKDSNVESYGRNCGLGADSVTIDHSSVTGWSTRLGISADDNLNVINESVVTGIIVESPAEDLNNITYSVMVWDGGLEVEAGSKVVGLGSDVEPNYGIATREGTIENYGNLEGYGYFGGVVAIGGMSVYTGSSILGTASYQDNNAKGVRVGGNLIAKGGSIEGQSMIQAVHAVGEIQVSDDATVLGIADLRVDGSAAVMGAALSIDNGGTIHEKYLGEVVEIDDETQVDPYQGSLNITNLSSYEWAAQEGKGYSYQMTNWACLRQNPVV